MKSNLYAVYDRVGEDYPFSVINCLRNDAAAERLFIDVIQNPKSPIHSHPEDYELHFLGTMDDQTQDSTPITPGYHTVTTGRDVLALLERHAQGANNGEA